MERQIASSLLSIGAVFLRPEQPFTWASGIKSPIYCDNRLTLSAPRVREQVENGLAKLVRRYYPDCEMLMGTSTAGIAHAAITATILDLPMGYVRGEAKTHGRTNRIEGKMDPGTKVVVIEDLISTGGSAIEVVEALREAGAESPPGGRRRGAGHREHLHLRDEAGPGAHRRREYREPLPVQPGRPRGRGRGRRPHRPGLERAHPRLPRQPFRRKLDQSITTYEL